MTANQRAKNTVDELFTDGTGSKATRLVLELGNPLGGSGWCKDAVIDRIEAALLAHAEAMREKCLLALEGCTTPQAGKNALRALTVE